MPAASFYQPLDGPDGARFHATAATAGPWFADAQHVGPPAALLVRAVERCAPRADLQLTRVTVEVLGPVPTGEVAVHAAVERAGRAIELVGAELVAGGRPVLRARGWRTAHTDTAAAAAPADPALLPAPAEVPTRDGRAPGWLPGYLDAVEWRWIRGGWDAEGDGALWARQRVPLVEGEEPSPVQRLAVVADSGNGISGRLDLRTWLYVNTDLTIHLHRQPAGEWVGIDARTVIGPTGAGTATAMLFDEVGQVGQGVQALIVRPR